MKHAKEYLQQAVDTMNSRASEYDKEAKEERNMARIVAMFNIAVGQDLTEVQGWAFMQCLKMVRLHSNPDTYHEDSAVDNISYSALEAEAWSRK
jgi:allophanate hydrolase subunit 1